MTPLMEGATALLQFGLWLAVAGFITLLAITVREDLAMREDGDES